MTKSNASLSALLKAETIITTQKGAIGSKFYAYHFDNTDLQAKLADLKRVETRQQQIMARDLMGQNALHSLLQNTFYRALDDTFLVAKKEATTLLSLSLLDRGNAEVAVAKTKASINVCEQEKATEEKRLATNGFDNQNKPFHKTRWHPTYPYSQYIPDEYVRNLKKDCNCFSCMHCKTLIQIHQNELAKLLGTLTNELVTLNSAQQQETQRKTFMEKLANEGNVSICSEFRNAQLPLLLETLLTPFNADAPNFLELMSSLDNRGLSPFHCLYRYFNAEQQALLAPHLLARVKNLLAFSDKLALAKVSDSEGKTIFHLMLINASAKLLQLGISSFSQPVVKDIFSLTDKKGNTALHTVLMPEVREVSDKLKLLLPFINPAPSTETTDSKQPLDKSTAQYYVGNGEKKNPLHLAAAIQLTDEKGNRDLKQEQEILDQVIKSCPKALYLEKLYQQDCFGNTPLHYAVKTGPKEKLLALLKPLLLIPDQKKRLGCLKNASHETIAHLACQHGNKGMLQTVLDCMDVETFFMIRGTNADAFKKQLTANQSLTFSEYNMVLNKAGVLFNIFYLLMEKYGFGIIETSDYRLALHDFSGCLISLEKQTVFPDLPPQILQKSPEYVELRNELQHVKPDQLKEFQAFFTEKRKEQNNVAKGLAATSYQEARPSMNTNTLFYSQANGDPDYLLIDVHALPTPANPEIEGRPATSSPGLD